MMDTLDTLAIALHEHYQSLQRAGFTKEEALTICIGIVTNSTE